MARAAPLSQFNVSLLSLTWTPHSNSWRLGVTACASPGGYWWGLVYPDPVLVCIAARWKCTAGSLCFLGQGREMGLCPDLLASWFLWYLGRLLPVNIPARFWALFLSFPSVLIIPWLTVLFCYLFRWVNWRLNEVKSYYIEKNETSNFFWLNSLD